MSNELKNHYGENTSWFCYEGSVSLKDSTGEKGTIDDDFEVYGEDEHGYDCSETVDVIELLESAHVIMEEQSTELEQLRKELEEVKQERKNVSVKYGDAWFDGFLRAMQIQAEDGDLEEYQDHDIALLSELAEAKLNKKEE